MYNRYIPQEDGTYRRSRLPDSTPKPPPPPPAERPAPPCPPPEPPKPSHPPVRYRPPRPPRRESPVENGSVLGFLRQLLPRDFDTGDLMVVLLLLLMSGDCAEDQNSALLTLALYLFM